MKQIKNYSKDRMKNSAKRIPAYVFVLAWVIFTTVMIGWIFLASFSSTRSIFTGKLISEGFTLANFTKAFVHNKALLNIVNSIIYSVPSCILIIIFSAPTAYCLSRFKFKGHGLITKLILICLGIPGIMIVMPLFSIVNTLKMSGSRFTLIILYTATSIPYTTFFLMSFFENISTSFEEAAAIDGCSPVRTFWQIMFPLAQPAVVTVTIFNFISKWNEYFMALIFANKANMRPIGVGLYQTVKSMMNSGDWAGMFASVVIVFLPTLIVYIFLSDRIVKGVTDGGVKG